MSLSTLRASVGPVTERRVTGSVAAMAGRLRALLAELSGGTVDPALLEGDLETQAGTLAELALLWSADVAPGPAEAPFRAEPWEGDGAG